MRRSLWKQKLSSWLVTSVSSLVTVASKIVILQSSGRNSDRWIWNHILGGLLRYKHQMLRCAYQFQSAHGWGHDRLFSDPATAEGKANGNSVWLSFPVPAEGPPLTNSCCATALPLLSALLLLPQGMPSLTSFSNLKCCRNWLTPLFTFANAFSGSTREASDCLFNLNNTRWAFWHSGMRQQSPDDFRIIISSKQVFLPMKCPETPVGGFWGSLSKATSWSIEWVRETLLVVPFENFVVGELLYGSRTRGWQVFEQKPHADAWVIH